MQTGSHLNSLDVRSPTHVDTHACKVINRTYCKLPIKCKKHRTSSPAVLSSSWKPGSVSCSIFTRRYLMGDHLVQTQFAYGNLSI